MRFSVPIVIATAALISATGVACGADGKLTGFDKFTFGMSEKALRTLVKIRKDLNEDGVHELYAEGSINVGGSDFERVFLLGDDGTVSAIHLTRELHVSADRCTQDFYRFFGQIKAKYGAPDDVVRSRSSGLIVNQFAVFTFPGTETIKIFGSHVGSLCLLGITYGQPLGGGTF